MSQTQITNDAAGASTFPQTNASLEIHKLTTVESILQQAAKVDASSREEFEKVFRAVETALKAQEDHITSQDSEITDLRAQLADLNAYIVKLTRTSVMPQAAETSKTERRKGLISDPVIFRGDEKDNKKNQDLFQTFVAQVDLKMVGDKDCFSSEKERIIYVASRVSGPAYKNIQSWVKPVIEDKEGGFKTWQEILDILQRVYGVADRRAAAEREMAALQQKNLPFVQFLAQFNTLLTDLDWDSSAKVSALKARINYELSEALIPIVQTPEYNDYDGWVKLLVKLAENSEAHMQRRRPEYRLNTNLSHQQQNQPSHSNAATLDPPDLMQLDAARLQPAERMRRLQGNLCLYCGKPGHYKSQCNEATNARFRGRGGMQGQRGAVHSGFRGRGGYNSGHVRAVGWAQASVTPESPLSSTPVPTPPESIVGDLKDQSSA
jgi:hypothetical protein